MRKYIAIGRLALCLCSAACVRSVGAVAASGPAILQQSSSTAAVNRVIQSTYSVLPALPTLEYQPLNIPRQAIALPAISVGPEQQLSSACFKSLKPSEGTPVLGEFAETVARESNFSGEFKASLEQALVKAGLSASVVSILMQRWNVRMVGLKLVEIDPAQIRANFQNEACTSLSGEWFINDRHVIAGAVKADSFSVTVGSLDDKNRSADLQAVIEHFGASLGLALSAKAVTSDSIRYGATAVFVGATRIMLGAKRCPFSVDIELPPGRLAAITSCDREVRAFLRTASSTSPYLIQVAIPGEGVSTGEVKVERNSAFRIPLGELRLAVGFLTSEPRTDGEHLTLDVTVLEVLPRGATP